MTTSRRWTLALVSIATAMLMLDIAVVNTAISDMGRDLGATLDDLKWVVDAYTLALAAVVLTAGSLADRFGRKRVFAIGLGVFTVTSGMAAAATDITTLNVIRAFQGLGAAAMFATSLALLANEFPGAQERAKALALYGATIGASFAVGPLVGGALTSGIGWESIFLINIPIGLFALVMTMRHVRESRDPRAPRVDWAGQATLTAGLFLLVLGLLRGNDDGWTSTPIVAELAAAVLLLAAFVAIQRRVDEPMMPLRFFRIPSFAGAQAAAFAISATFFALFLYFTLYLQQVLGLSAIEAGLVYLPGTVLNFLVAGASAQLAEKVSPRVMVSGGLALVAVGMLLMTGLGTDSHWTATLPGLLVAMVGTGMFNPALSAVALGTLPEEHSGLAAGVNDMFRQAGIAVGVAALGAMISTDSLLTGDRQQYVDSMVNATVIAAGVAAIGALAAAALIGRRARAERDVVSPSSPALPASEPAAA